MSTLQEPRRGEIWLVQFAPAQGEELTNPHPALVLSRNDVGVLPLRVVVPLTTFQNLFEKVPWMLTINATKTNGLHHKSVIDYFQPRSFDMERFVEKWGKVTSEQVEQAARTVAQTLGVE